MYDFILTVVFLLVTISVVAYYEHQLNKAKTENDKLKTAIHPATRGVDHDFSDLRSSELWAHVPYVNLNKNRTLPGKARRTQRKNLNKLRNYAERDVAMVIDGHTSPKLHVVPPAMQDEVDKFFADTPVEVTDLAHASVTTGWE